MPEGPTPCAACVWLALTNVDNHCVAQPDEAVSVRFSRCIPYTLFGSLARGERTPARVVLLVRQVLIWGLPVDPIFADGAAKLRRRAAPSARIETHILFLTDHYHE